MRRSFKSDLLIVSFAFLSVTGFLIVTLGELGQSTFDDSFMFVRYARHWLAGNGFSWNTVDGASYGITSPAYLILITALVGLTNCSAAMVLTVASFVSGLLAVAVLTFLGFQIQKNEGLKRGLVPLLVVPAFILFPPFRYHCLTGMETTFSLLVNSILACAVVSLCKNRTVYSSAICILAGMLSFTTRPDNGIYVMLLPPLYLVLKDRKLLAFSVCHVVVMTILIASSLLVNKHLFGGMFPLPFYAKSQGFYEGYTGMMQWNAMKEMFVFGVAVMPFLLLLVLSLSKRAFRRVAVVLALVVMTFTYYATVSQIMGFQARYYYPSSAFVVFAAFLAFFERQKEISAEQRIGGVSELRVFLGFLVLLPASVYMSRTASQLWAKHVISAPPAAEFEVEYRVAADKKLPQLGWWESIKAMEQFLKLVPQDVTLTASEYGYIGAEFLDMTIIDLVGLHDKFIAHNGFSAEYVLSRKPEIIWFPHHHYTCAVAALQDAQAFKKGYEYFPGAYDYGVALHKESPRYTQIRKAFSENFSRVYPGEKVSDYVATTEWPQ